MKKTLLTTAALALLTAGVMAQGSRNAPRPFKKNAINTVPSEPSVKTKIKNRCGTIAPSAEWDAAFNQDVEAY